MSEDEKVVAEGPKKRQKVENPVLDLSGPHVLNVATFPDGYPRPYGGPRVPAAELTERLHRDLGALYARFLDGADVDYDGLRHSEEMTKMVQTMEAFQTLDLGELPLSARTALCLNLYNLLCIHIVLHQLPPGSTSNEVPNFFTQNFYAIGGIKYCLNDIEHGIVRGDRASRRNKSAQSHFSPEDPRKSFSLPLDPRVHAAMVCAGKGCPIIRLYSSANIDKELTDAMIGFVMRDTTVDVANKTVFTSEIIDWYDADFGTDTSERLRYMQTFSTGEVQAQLTTLLSENNGADVTVKFIPYQWALNGTLTSR